MTLELTWRFFKKRRTSITSSEIMPLRAFFRACVKVFTIRTDPNVQIRR